MQTHVIFDFDGTLADTKDLVLSVYNEIAVRNGYAVFTSEQVNGLRHLPIQERCAVAGIPLYRLPMLVMEIGRRLRPAMLRSKLQSGVLEMLREVRLNGFKLGIISTNTEENIRVFLKRQGVEAWFDEILCNNLLFGKATLLRSLMKRAHLHPQQLVYVGDECRDIDACHKAGVKVLAVAWGFESEPILRAAMPTGVVRHPQEVIEWLKIQKRRGDAGTVHLSDGVRTR